jgi:hypothetical protein
VPVVIDRPVIYDEGTYLAVRHPQNIKLYEIGRVRFHNFGVSYITYSLDKPTDKGMRRYRSIIMNRTKQNTNLKLRHHPLIEML